MGNELKRILLCFCCMFLVWGVRGQLPPGATPYEVQVSGTPDPGYMFIGPRSLNPSDLYPSSLMLLDAEGELIWYAEVADDTAAPYFNFTVYDFKPLGGGFLSYWQPKFTGGKFFILDSTFTVVDSVSCPSRPATDEHDIIRQQDGSFIMICADDTVLDASALNTTTGAQGSQTAVVPFQEIQELDINRNIAFVWNILDHIPIEDSDTAHFNGPSFLDYSHVNSVFRYGDEVVISSRNLNEITSFSRSTGEVYWRLGGKGNQFLIVGDSIPFRAQHDANVDDNGHVYFFDNGSEGAGSLARYVEYELDTAAMVATLVREHRHPKNYRSLFMGNSIKLPNDHVIVAWGGCFPQDSTAQVTEFAPDGSIVMELDLPEDYLTYRVHKEALPFKLPRPQLTCDNAAQTLTAPWGHDSYWWSNGETTRSIVVQDTGTYQVWVNQGMGRISSEKVYVGDVSNVCAGVSVPEFAEELLRVYPNPVLERLSVELPPDVRRVWTLEVRDVLGRVVMREKGRTGEIEVEVGEWAEGVYSLRLEGRNGKVYRGKFVKQ